MCRARFEDFAHHVAYRLGARGELALASRLVDALTAVIPHAAANLDGELATQLADAGRHSDAQARIRDELVELRRKRYEAHARSRSVSGLAVNTLRSEEIGPFGRKVGRNEACPCGSGRKFKHCHGRH